MKHHTKKIVSYIITIAVIAAAAVWVATKFIHLGDVEFTDNAQVKQQIVPVNSRVQGYIKEIRFEEYQAVKKGDTLVIIDDADMRLNLARAKADYQNALAGRDVADKAVVAASANVAVSDASITEAKVLMELAAADLAVMKNLSRRMRSQGSSMMSPRQTMKPRKPAMRPLHGNVQPHLQPLM